MARSRAVALASLVAFACASEAPRASAAPPPASKRGREDEARTAIKRGLAAFARGDAEGALGEYKRAQELVPEANLPHRYAAEALVQLQRYEEAIKEYERYLEIKRDVSDADAVRDRIAEIRSKLEGTITVTSVPGGAMVFRVTDDGGEQRLGTTPLVNVKLPRGQHKLVVRMPDRVDVTLTPDIAGGAHVDLACDLQLLPEPVRPPPPPRHAEEPAKTERSTNYAPWIMAGSGVVVLGASVAVDAIVLGSTLDDFDAARRNGDANAGSLQKRASTLRTGLAISYTAGALLAVGGTVWLLLGGGRSERAVVKTAIVPSLDPHGAGASWVGAF